jgi:hypothetical protein
MLAEIGAISLISSNEIKRRTPTGLSVFVPLPVAADRLRSAREPCYGLQKRPYCVGLAQGLYLLLNYAEIDVI